MDLQADFASVIIVSLGRLITVLKSAKALDRDITCK